MRGNVLAKVLRKIADAVDKLDEAEFDQFLISLSLLKLPRSTPQRADRSSKNRHAKVDTVALEKVLDELARLTTREAGKELLDRADFSRKELEMLARLRHIHFTKDDNVAKIKEKLVETIIGSRLSSRAIRGA